MKRLIIYFLAAIFLLNSCDDYLNIIPKDKFIPTTLEDYENMLNDVECCSYGDYFTDLMTDNVFIPEPTPSGLWTKQKLSSKKIYIFDNECYPESDIDQMWSQSYRRMFYYNSVINDVLDAKGDLSRKKNVRAEALLFRAAEHLNLVNLYAKHYNPETAEEDPGVPLVLAADINEKHRRNTVKEVYDQIIADLNEAIPDLPERSLATTKFRGCKAGGYALLSRAYLFMSQYDKALENANAALNEYSTLVDMNQYMVISPGPFPYVPGAPLGWTNIPDGQYHPESIVARHFLRPFGLGMDVCASSDLTSLFDNNDMRWTLYYANGWPPAPPYNYWNTYGVKIYLRGDYYNNFLSTPEVYLIRAECNARKNKLQEALDDINLLRRNRIVPAAYSVLELSDFPNGDDVLRFVLNERRRELAFTGMRHIDLKRLNLDPRFSKEVRHTAEGHEYILLPNSPKYLRQIWPAASKFNPDWELNPTE
jgi:tetratricopeptide (TPR) repeat protein